MSRILITLIILSIFISCNKEEKDCACGEVIKVYSGPQQQPLMDLQNVCDKSLIRYGDSRTDVSIEVGDIQCISGIW